MQQFFSDLDECKKITYLFWSMAFTTQILIKLTLFNDISWRFRIPISPISINQYRFYKQWSTAVTGPIYTKLTFTWHLLINSCTKFHENSTNDLIANTKSDVDGCTDRMRVRFISIQGIHFHFGRNLYNLTSETGKVCHVMWKCTMCNSLSVSLSAVE
jgi:hypothetical protein